jgi:hypothetical protein
MRITKSVERWFVADDDPDKSEVLIRHLKKGELIDITFDSTAQVTRYVADEDKKITPETTATADPRKQQVETFCKAVKDWKNFYDEDGEPIECTKENKVRAMREIDGLFEFVQECRERLAKDIEAESKAQEKN